MPKRHHLNMSMKTSKHKKVLCPHKKTDFRYALWIKERKTLRDQARKNSFRVDISDRVKPLRGAVSVDTSKARSNTPLIRLCLRELGMKEYPFGKRDGTSCDVYWHGGSYGDLSERSITSGKINKFPGMVQISRKVNLGRSLDTMRSLFPEEYSFHPRSWFLPQQFAEFCDDVRRLRDKRGKDDKPVFIVKPDDGTQGDGIYLITDPHEYHFRNKQHVVQEYLADPFLIDGLKFDLRIYVILKSIEPLTIYIYNEGLARFCTRPYERPNNKNIHQAYMHLTNYSLNKRSSTYEHTENDYDGSKRKMTRVFKKLRRRGHDTAAVWEEIKKVVVKTIISMTPDLKVEMRAEIPNGKQGPSSFQILGFDIILLKNLKPMLLEVNSSPSLRVDYEHEVAPGIHEYLHSPLDEEIKRPLVRETLLLVSPQYKLRSMQTNAKKRADKIVEHRSTSAKEDASSSNVSSAHSSLRRQKTINIISAPKSGKRTEEPSQTEDKEHSVIIEDGTPLDKECLEPDLSLFSEIFPEPYGNPYQELRILERTVEIFMFSLGVRGNLRMGATQFRNFARRCKLISGMSGTDFDILYIALHRRWEHKNPEGIAGLCFQGFLEAFLMLAQARSKNDTDPLTSLISTLDHCEMMLGFGPDHKPNGPPPFHRTARLTRRKRQGEGDGGSITNTPRIHTHRSDTYDDDDEGALKNYHVATSAGEHNSRELPLLPDGSINVYQQAMDIYKREIPKRASIPEIEQ